MKKDIVIFGAGGLGREVFSMFNAFPEWNVKGFYDDGKPMGEKVGKLSVLGSLSDLIQVRENTDVVIAIGSPSIKRKLVELLSVNKFISFPTLIHHNSLIQDPASVQFGEGCIITAGAILTTDIHIGKHVLLNLNCTIGHDVLVGEYSSIMPGANIAGEVKIGSDVFIGAGANILNGIHLGEKSIIGAGAVVTNDVMMSDTVVGVPARSIRKTINSK